MRSIILVIEICSSSVQCTACEYHGSEHGHGHRDGRSDNCFQREAMGYHSQPRLAAAPPSTFVIKHEDICHTISLVSVDCNTGHIKIFEVLSTIDGCIDEVLRLLRERKEKEEEEKQTGKESEYQIVGIGFSSFGNFVGVDPYATIDGCIDEVLRLLRERKEKEEEKKQTGKESEYQIVGIGFSSFGNFVGVDPYGEPVGETATVSHACTREDVVRECQRLRDTLGPEKLDDLHQRTGTPVHPSYALPQLLAFYGNVENQSLARKITQWQTISSVCIYRWRGRPETQMPISHSEASLTGMYDFRDCFWDEEAARLFETCNGITQYAYGMADDDDIDLLPRIADYDALLWFPVQGIPQYNVDRSENPYWMRWPELRSTRLKLFLSFGNGATANIGSKCGRYMMPDWTSYK
eukprot:CAMPEP_0184441584 /NCGR_PEP_ID=MMETSP0738-20130409/756157_1 /TAXON_ID=385413 /ORGANISM="Thalassiosira miniscula, Strain CCMP1093" /LENGTH=408 /DNA_ID=CAMNT_0026809513 /DNA_START=141 /DNA_END=1367 /DNA_ORIENTATION=-